MLLLVTIGLVLVGTVCLIIGFVQSSLPFIYVSIACSVGAAIVLLIFSRMASKSQQVVTAGEGPAPLDVDAGQPAEAAVADPQLSATFAPEAPMADPEPVTATQAVAAVPVDEDEEEGYFPIEDYDQLKVAEILPLLPELDLDELDMVREREEQGKNRSTLLARIDQLVEQLEAEESGAPAAPAPVVDERPAPAAVAESVDDLEDEEPEDEEEAAFATPVAAAGASPMALADDDDYFPIEDYDDLRAAEILPLLPELDDDELEMVRDREQAGAARSSILRRIDALMPDGAPAPAPAKRAAKPAPVAAAPESPVAVEAAPVKKASRTTKAPAAKAPAAAKAAPAKAAATTKKAAKAPAAAAKAAATKAPAAKAAKATKAPSASRTRKAAATSGLAEAEVDAVPAKKAAATKATKKATKKAVDAPTG